MTRLELNGEKISKLVFCKLKIFSKFLANASSDAFVWKNFSLSKEYDIVRKDWFAFSISERSNSKYQYNISQTVIYRLTNIVLLF